MQDQFLDTVRKEGGAWVSEPREQPRESDFSNDEMLT